AASLEIEARQNIRNVIGCSRAGVPHGYANSRTRLNIRDGIGQDIDTGRLPWEKVNIHYPYGTARHDILFDGPTDVLGRDALRRVVAVDRVGTDNDRQSRGILIAESHDARVVHMMDTVAGK